MTEMFSVAMCVYGGDDPQWFDRALESVTVGQIVKPKEIVLVVDGPIPETIETVIEKYNDLFQGLQIDFKIVRFETNQGHGNARRASVDNSSYDIVALMDADDVSFENRFKLQIELLKEKNVDVCGGYISEFIGEENNIVSYRKTPFENKDIVEYAKSRCPMNQVTVMFRKEAYYKAGGYIDWFWEEDYYLWLRMIKNGATFANVEEVLVNVRVGEDMYKRRGGLKYYKSEKKLQKYMLKEHFIGFPKYVVNCLKRFIVQVLLPNKIRGWVFKKFARS
ncbi:MAG: glycosyltransferase [Clostridia bacterium]|nr:glycosyltransferase [Clostridia bacterium]